MLTAALILTIAILAYVLWVKSRRRGIDLVVPAGADITSLFRSMAALTWGRVIDGNRVTIVQNSTFFDALLDDAANARNHIHLETFLWRDGAVSDRIAAALAKKAREGIAVRVLVDQRGAAQTNPAVWALLRAAGCDFRVFHRARLREFAWYNHRDHRKIAVIDGSIAYTFGHGIADMWGASADQPSGWRDTAARIEGPAVGEMQTAFFDNWVRSAGVVPSGGDYFPRLEHVGHMQLHVAYMSPRETVSAVERLYYFAIAAARREIILQNPYFLPSRHALRLFIAAAKRGVKIAIMLPTALTSDFPVVQHASHFFYGPLLRHGIRVIEYTRSGLHQKVMIVDGVWCSIGSTNFDRRSFRINDEISVAICDSEVAAELREAFEQDMQNADEWTLARWNARTLSHRMKDRLSALLKRQL
jgi:cardiolipin synthase